MKYVLIPLFWFIIRLIISSFVLCLDIVVTGWYIIWELKFELWHKDIIIDDIDDNKTDIKLRYTSLYQLIWAEDKGVLIKKD